MPSFQISRQFFFFLSPSRFVTAKPRFLSFLMYYFPKLPPRSHFILLTKKKREKNREEEEKSCRGWLTGWLCQDRGANQTFPFAAGKKQGRKLVGKINLLSLPTIYTMEPTLSFYRYKVCLLYTSPSPRD